MGAGTGEAQPAAPRGDVANNWVPVAGIGALFLGGAVTALVVDGDTRRTAAYFVVSTLVLILVAAPWLVSHPPALAAPPGGYLVLGVAVELGALVGGAVEAFHGLGAWVVLGVGLAVYGQLERAHVMVTAGGVAAVLGVVAIAAALPWLTLGLALATSAFLVLAAWRLRRLGPHGRLGPHAQYRAVRAARRRAAAFRRSSGRSTTPSMPGSPAPGRASRWRPAGRRGLRPPT